MLNELEAISQNILYGSIVSAYHDLTERLDISVLVASALEAKSLADELFRISSKELFWQEGARETGGAESYIFKLLASEARFELDQLASEKKEISDKLAVVGGSLLKPTKEVLEQTYGFLLASTEYEVKDMVIDLIRKIENNEIEISIDFDAPRNKYGQIEDPLDAKGNISFIEKGREKPMLRVRPTIIIDMVSWPHYNIVYALLAAFDSAGHFDGEDADRSAYTMSTVRRIVRNATQEKYDLPLPPFLTWYLRTCGGN